MSSDPADDAEYMDAVEEKVAGDLQSWVCTARAIELELAANECLLRRDAVRRDRDAIDTGVGATTKQLSKWHTLNGQQQAHEADRQMLLARALRMRRAAGE